MPAFIEALGALPIQALLLQIGLGLLDVGFGGLFRGNTGGNIRLGGGDGGLLAGNTGLLLHVLDGGHGLALLDHVPFLHIEVGDAAHGGGAHVYIGLGLDLAGAADDRGQILALDLGGQNLGVAGLLPPDKDAHQHDNNHDAENHQEYLLDLHMLRVLQVFLFLVYAKGANPVPEGVEMGHLRGHDCRGG